MSLKLLLHSNGPRSGTGYGVQTALLAARLAADGHQVAISCTHGHDAGIGMWETPAGDKIRLYPRRFDATGADILHGHANHWFEGDTRGGWIIPLIDVWALTTPALVNYNVAAWAPVDHLDVPPGVSDFFTQTGAHPIAMSVHGEQAYIRKGLDPTYIPLAVDTKVFKPTFSLDIDGTLVDSRALFELPDDAFVVGMVAMNKGNVFDRKGWSEAFYGFARFREKNPGLKTVLFVHSDRFGAQGISLNALATDAGIPPTAIVFSNQYAYTIGFSSEMMAAAYTAMDVLLCPSHGEGFGVPMIESQACGTPVIASDATAQSELVGAGWLVSGQRIWDESQHCAAFLPFIEDIADKLTEAMTADLPAMQATAIEFAAGYDADLIYDRHWRPFLATLSAPEPDADQDLMTDVAVVIPVMQRPHRVPGIVESFKRANDGTATLYFVCDPDDDAEIKAIRGFGLEPLISHRGGTFAQKANTAYAETTESFIFVCGDDVEFTPGWLEAARELSDRYDVIGTNDSYEGEVRNPDVAARRHADHWFTRRTYIDEVGACLEGPGEFCPEAYYHWWVDREVIGLARARGVFSACLDSRVIHHHPGYAGDEQARREDPVYMRAVEWSERDRVTFMRRVPLIEQQRVARGIS